MYIGIDGLINKLHTSMFAITPIRMKVYRPENLILCLRFSLNLNVIPTDIPVNSKPLHQEIEKGL
jgi:hypothetical protein